MHNGTFVEDAFSITPNDLLADTVLRPDITYWSEDGDDTQWSISIAGGDPAGVGMEWDSITFGKRAYFVCSCGRRASKLYLPANSTGFKCRICHGLRYQLTAINRHSVAGRSIYRFNRMQKLANNRANMSRIFYNGNYTKRFERFIDLCDRAGLDSIVQGANDLKALING